MKAETLIDFIENTVDSTDELNMQNYSYEDVEALNIAMNNISAMIKVYREENE